MTRDDVLRMAREAGIPDDNITGLCHGRLETGVELLERFAALVAAAERDACALVAEDGDHVVDVRGWHAQLGDANATARNIAAAIRARGGK